MNIGNSGTLGRWVTARHMALAGYITKIIMIETGLTYKQVRRLYQDLERDGYTLERKSRTTAAWRLQIVVWQNMSFQSNHPE